MKLPLLTCGLFLAIAACGGKSADEPIEAAKPDAGAVVEESAAATTLPRTASVDGANVFFISPADGATVTNPISIEFGISGMDIVKAGNNQPGSGHHHLLIDTGLPDLGLPIPADEHHVHFGDGSTDTEISLPPGEHTLQLLLGDFLHIPHQPPVVSEAVTITVE